MHLGGLDHISLPESAMMGADLPPSSLGGTVCRPEPGLQQSRPLGGHLVGSGPPPSLPGAPEIDLP